MDYGWKKLMCEKVPLSGGMAGMCGHGCMVRMVIMMMLTLNINARA